MEEMEIFYQTYTIVLVFNQTNDGDMSIYKYDRMMSTGSNVKRVFGWTS